MNVRVIFGNFQFLDDLDNNNLFSRDSWMNYMHHEL